MVFFLFIYFWHVLLKGIVYNENKKLENYFCSHLPSAFPKDQTTKNENYFYFQNKRHPQKPNAAYIYTKLGFRFHLMIYQSKSYAINEMLLPDKSKCKNKIVYKTY